MTSLARDVLSRPKALFGACLVWVAVTGIALLTSLGASVAAADAQASSVLYVATGGSDAASCTKSAPCASFARAYRLAAPGTAVEVAGGSYPRQTLTVDAAKSGGADVVFRPTAGTSVTLAEFVSGDTSKRIGAKRFELRDFKISSYVRVRWGSEDVTLRNIDAAGLNITSASRVKVLGGDYGPVADGVSHINACGVEGCFPAEDVLIDGALFHDYTVTDPAKHSECLLIWPGRRVTIRNSTFRNCTDFDVLVKPYKTGLVGLPGEITFENNFFDEPIVGDGRGNRGGNAIALTQGSGEAWSGVRILYNSSLGGFRIDPAIQNAVVKGNVARKDSNFSCQRNAAFSFNVWNGTKCSATDRRAALPDVFVDASSTGFDLDLRRGSAAIGAGDPLSAPRTDREGRVRPRTLAADAGASQREPALAQAGRGIGTVTLRMPRAAVTEWYGEPLRRTFVDGSKPGQRIELETRSVRGGLLRVHYLDGRVVAVSTTSRFYRTPKNLGPGVPLVPRPNDKRICRPVGTGGLYVTPTRRGKTVVAELTVAVRHYAPPCAQKPKS
ncbi:MAG: hypothetical protein MSC30_05325 [Gaiellaceae bacterium MAG52_C11]|nr:hypothetical protein [Candidatus Gaiellasilicea maunaloa]